jgi:hypothetical protein
MIDDAFVFDGVCHVFNFDKSNAFGKPGEMFIEHLYAFHQVLNAPARRPSPAKSTCANGRRTKSRAWFSTKVPPT